jgi:hypothetical protein
LIFKANRDTQERPEDKARQDEIEMLKKFDLDPKYGPCYGMCFDLSLKRTWLFEN